MRSSGRFAVGSWLLASALWAQAPELANVLAPFADNDLPRWLSRLHGWQHDQAVAQLAALGPCAHRCLFGRVRLPHAGPYKDYTGAFGGFGPESAWALPGLLELAAGPSGLATPLGLMQRLGPTARPLIPLLERQRGDVGKALAAALVNAAPVDVEPRPLPRPDTVDAAWRNPLLALLSEPAERSRWWPALQAAIAIDDATAGAAAAVLVHQSFAADATVGEHARDLLRALRCHFAAFAVLDLDIASALPEPARSTEMRRCVLATSPALTPPTANLGLPAPGRDALLQLANAKDPQTRFLAALSAAMHQASNDPPTIQDTALLQQLAADTDEPTGRLAQLVMRRDTVLADRLMQRPLTNEPASSSLLGSLAALDGFHLARMPAARVREAIRLVGPPRAASPQPADGQNLAQQLLTAAQTSPTTPTRAYSARELLVALATRAPAHLLACTDLPADELASLHALVLGTTAPAPELHPWLVDAISPPPPNDDRMGLARVPIVVAPTLFARLRSGEHVDHAVGVLHSVRNYLDWAEAIDGEAETLVKVARQVGAARQAQFAGLFAHGHHCRRALERLLLDATTPDAMRQSLLNVCHSNLDRFPPSGAFVVAALEAADPKLNLHALSLAGYIQERQDAIVQMLLARWPGPDPKADSAIVSSFARLRAAAALPKLRERLRTSTGRDSIRPAVAILDIDDQDAEAAASLLARIDGQDAELRRLAWRSISHSPGASARFLELALQRLTDGGWEDHHRCEVLLRNAAVRRPDDTLKALQVLTRHPDKQLANQAAQALTQLRDK